MALVSAFGLVLLISVSLSGQAPPPGVSTPQLVLVAGAVFGHGGVYFKGERMSKTMGNIVDPLDAAERFGPDPRRRYQAKEIT